MLPRSREGSEKELGHEHPDTFKSVSNLGKGLYRQGEYEGWKEVMHQRVLEAREKVVGREHPDTLKLLQENPLAQI